MGFQGLVLKLTGLGPVHLILEGRAPKADPSPRLQVYCGLTFDNSCAELSWSWRASSDVKFEALLGAAGSLGFPTVHTGL